MNLIWASTRNCGNHPVACKPKGTRCRNIKADSAWTILYIERWLKAPTQLADGMTVDRDRGTPQGGCISPVLSNLFLHYVFDRWMSRTFPQDPWCRYADDGLVHYQTQAEAELILNRLTSRFMECGLALHPDKTKIVYCRNDEGKRGKMAESFNFLGFTFRKRSALNRKTGKVFNSFQPAVGPATIKDMRKTVKREWKLTSATHVNLAELAGSYNPVIRGWMQYYGAFYKSALQPIARYINDELTRWFMRKYRSNRIGKKQAHQWLKGVYKRDPRLFTHWGVFPVY